MKRIGIYGGSFNPVHLGHIRLANTALNELSLEKLIIVPTFIQPFKRDIEYDNHLDRLNMLKLSFDNPKIEISSFEIDKGDISYTYDTLTYYKTIYPDYEIVFILGTDSFMNILNWYKGYNLITEFSFAVAIRPEDKVGDYLSFVEQLREEFDSTIYFIQGKMFELSSTEIRDRIKNNLSFDNYLNENVTKYIKENGLYKD